VGVLASVVFGLLLAEIGQFIPAQPPRFPEAHPIDFFFVSGLNAGGKEKRRFTGKDGLPGDRG